MYQILSFQLPVKPNRTDEDIIDALAKWVSESPYYKVQKGELKKILLSHPSFDRGVDEDLAERKVYLQFRRLTEDHVHYIEMRLDNPTEENNLQWRAECIFCRREDEQAGTFQISLWRKPVQPDKPVCLDAPVYLPDIARYLRVNDYLPTEDGGGAEFYPEPSRSRFPVIYCNEVDLEIINWLEKRLSPIAQVVKQATGKAKQGGILFDYPIARIQKSYSLLDSGGRVSPERANQAAADVFRWVTEIHAPEAIPWREPPESATPAPETTQGEYYCVFGPAMGRKLRELRRRTGLSQQDLARKVDSTGLIISRLENAQKKRVPFELVKNIERALGVEEGTISAAREEAENEPPTFEEEQPPKKSGYCRRCGLHLFQDSLFCPKCGTKVLQ